MPDRIENRLSASGQLPDTDIQSVLIAAGFSVNDAQWIEFELQAGPYTHYSIIRERRENQTTLLIDTYLLDTSVNSRTGKTGESPHGTRQDYILDADECWVANGFCHYQ